MKNVKSYIIRVLDEDGLGTIIESDKIKSEELAMEALNELECAFELCGIENGIVCVLNYND